MKRIVDAIKATTCRVSGGISSWLVVILMIMVAAEVVARYVFSRPLKVADEIGAYMLVAIGFIGLAHSWKEKSHIRIRFVVDRLSEKVRNRLRMITLSIATAFIPVVIFASYGLVAESHMFGIKSSSWLRIPQEWPRMVLLIGVIMLFLVMTIDLVNYWKSLRSAKGKGSWTPQ